MTGWPTARPESCRQAPDTTLSGGPALEATLARVEAADGHITTPKVARPGGMGVFAPAGGTEGNRIRLHAAA